MYSSRTADRYAPLNLSSPARAREAQDWYHETLRDLDAFGNYSDAELQEMGLED